MLESLFGRWGGLEKDRLFLVESQWLSSRFLLLFLPGAGFGLEKNPKSFYAVVRLSSVLKCSFSQSVFNVQLKFQVLIEGKFSEGLSHVGFKIFPSSLKTFLVCE